MCLEGKTSSLSLWQGGTTSPGGGWCLTPRVRYIQAGDTLDRTVGQVGHEALAGEEPSGKPGCATA